MIEWPRQLLRRAERIFGRDTNANPYYNPHYIDNLLNLGRLATTHGYDRNPDPTFVERYIESTEDPTKGFSVEVHFLMRPHPTYRTQDHYYTYLVLTKRGPNNKRCWEGNRLPSSDVKIVLKSDWLTCLEVHNYPNTQATLAEIARFQPLENTFETVEGVLRKRQGIFICDSFIDITAEPNGWCAKGQRFLGKFTKEALVAFARYNPQLVQRRTLSENFNPSITTSLLGDHFLPPS